MKEKGCFVCVVLLMLVGAFFSFRGIHAVICMTEKNKVIVIDSGHGGNDPGKVGAAGTKEKDLNLAIAKKVRDKLTKAGFQVIMTREEDVCLADSGSTNKKRVDMERRIQIIEKSNPMLVISIHQNSYSSSEVRGAQTFYHKESEKSKEWAEQLQGELISQVDPANKRTAKADSSYYLLKKSSCPCVIIECGFLSNQEEEKNLNSDLYQEKIASSIATVFAKCKLE